MKPELVEEYKRVLANLLNAIDNKQAEFMLNMLERIDDDLEDLQEEFERNRPDARKVRYWIAVLRLIRYSQSVKQQTGQNYDEFVTAYQKLHATSKNNEDEKKLEQEIGELLYRIDDTFGDYDRLVVKLIVDLHNKLVGLYGIQLEPGPEVFHGQMTPENADDIYPQLERLIEICAVMRQQINIEQVLMRLYRSILPPS